jgi:hypothetical protein
LTLEATLIDGVGKAVGSAEMADEMQLARQGITGGRLGTPDKSELATPTTEETIGATDGMESAASSSALGC